MNNDNLIAKTISQVVEGTPKVLEYTDQNGVSKIDVYIGENRPYEDVTTYSTIGLSNYDIGLKSNDDKDIRVEFIGACESKFAKFGNILSSCAFNVINDHFSCQPGTIYPNVVNEYYDDLSMKHILFTDPFLWENLEYIETPGSHITWLMTVPISNNEFEFAKNNSVEELENLFAEKEINIFDLNRESVI